MSNLDHDDFLFLDFSKRSTELPSTPALDHPVDVVTDIPPPRHHQPTAPMALPKPSRAERPVPAASLAHCTTHAVLGGDDGYRIQSESHLEFSHQMILNCFPNVSSIQEQVFFFFGWNPKFPIERIFDMVVTLNCGSRVAVTVKPEIRLVSGEFLKDMGEVAWWVKKLGFADELRLLTDADLDPVSLENAKIFAAVREIDAEADAVAMDVAMSLPLGGGRSLRELVDQTNLAGRGYRALVRLVRRDVLRLAKHEVIKPKSVVMNATNPGLLPDTLAPKRMLLSAAA